MKTINLQNNINHVYGSLYGIPGPIFIINLRIPELTDYNYSKLDKLLKDSLLINNDLYSSQTKVELDKLDIDDGDFLTLIKKMFIWYNQIHFINKTPISRKSSIISIDKSYRCILNIYNSDLSYKILLFIIKLFNDILDEEKKLSSKYIHDFINSISFYSLKGTNNRRFLEAAIELELPYKIVSNQVFLFGQGKHLYRLMSSTTDETSAIGARTAKIKNISSDILRLNGLPCAPQYVVNDLNIALSFASKIGYPVVLKPNDQDQGKGVSSNIKTEKDLIEIYNITKKEFSNLIVEKHVFGDDYRFTVVDNKVLKVFKRIAAGIIGDGINNISQLIENAAKDFLSKKFNKNVNKIIKLDEESMSLMKEKNYNVDTILKENEYLPLRRKNNVSAGGEQILIDLSTIHPDNINLALKAANVFNLDMAGIDIISPDISVSWLETNTIICEVNAIPEIGYNLTPNIYKEILDKNANIIPTTLYILEENKLNDKDFINNIYRSKKYKHFSINNLVAINNKTYTNRCSNGFQSSEILLINKEVDEAHCFITVELIKKYGLPACKFDKIDIYVKNEELNEILKLHTNSLKIHFTDFEI